VTAIRGADGRFLSPRVRDAIARGRSPDLTPEQIREAAAPIPLQRAVAGEHVHRHYRDDGRGYVSHQHRVRSERHSHPALGLALVSLRWIGFSWGRLGGAVVYVGTTAVFVGFGVMALLGWWFWVRAQ
jgi:hypothetical protein